MCKKIKNSCRSKKRILTAILKFTILHIAKKFNNNVFCIDIVINTIQSVTNYWFLKN